MKQLAPSPWRQGCSNTPSPSVFTRFARPLQALWKPLSQACPNNLLQNHGSSGAPLHFFIFDLLVLKGKDVMGLSIEVAAQAKTFP
jgi:hypothetical protein